MGQAETESGFGSDPESTLLLLPPSPEKKSPADSYQMGYIIYFTLGLGFLLPWNAFITAVDYFSLLYPAASVDRVFGVVYMLTCLFVIFLIVLYSHKTDNFLRINLGLGLFVGALMAVPIIDWTYVRGRVGVYGGFDATVAAVALAGIADSLVQGGIVGSAGELPERYMQAVVAGTAGSGVLVSFLRILTKAIYPQDARGLRNSANLYFAVSIAILIVSIVFYNLAPKLAVMKHYKQLKIRAAQDEAQERGGGPLTGAQWRSTLWDIVGRVKLYGFGIVVIYAVTLSIFPGYISEDVHSEILGDWYSVLLIAGYNVFDLVGKSLTAIWLIEDERIAVGGSVSRLLFVPLFYGCLHGPKYFRTEIPVSVLTCLLGLTNGYLTSVLMILGPKAVPIHHSETAGIVIVLFLIVGLAVGSVVSWFWVI